MKPKTQSENERYFNEVNDRMAELGSKAPGAALTFPVDSMSCRRCGSPMTGDPSQIVSGKLPEGLQYSDPHLGQFVSVVWAKCLRPTCCPSEDNILDAIEQFRDGHCPAHGAIFIARSSDVEAWRQAHAPVGADDAQ